jgi:hypothetical protein
MVKSTYPFVNVPTPIYRTLLAVSHTRVGLEVPVNMVGFLPLALFR